MPLDFRSSVLTTVNTPWGKYRWLRMPFHLKVSGDVFQERLDRVLRLVPGVPGIMDDILIHGATENTHDGTVLVLCETVRLNNLSLNSKTMQFKSTDCKFFRHRLTRWHQRGPQEDRSHNTDGSSSKCGKLTVFQWNGQLPKEVQSSLVQTLRATQETGQVWS